MKFALPLAAILALGALAPAQAYQDPFHKHRMPRHETSHTGFWPHHHDRHWHHDRCHGQSAGTAHHTCGTRTGGPAGGLH